MVHRIIGWINGYVRFYIKGYGCRRFVNLCRNHGIELWDICWNKECDMLYCNIRLNDFWHLQPLTRKCRVAPIIIGRYGLPFILQAMRKRSSFFVGVACFFVILLLLSQRIWGIELEGESYHTKASVVKYLDGIGVYSGMAVCDVECSKLEDKLRHYYEDVGWVSVELKGSMLYIRIREVRLVNNNTEVEKPGSIIAEDDGKIVSIVTSQGTAKVIKGDSVRKGKVLISGVVKVIGDNDELVRRRKVHAEGKVILQSQEEYSDKLDEIYDKKEYTGRKKYLYQLIVGNNNLFLHNPLNNLETYSKCDIIREGGQLCPSLSSRFPVFLWSKCFAEVKYTRTKYTVSEAKKELYARYRNYICQEKKAGYKIVKNDFTVSKSDGCYIASATIVRRKRQTTYCKIKVNNKGKKTDGNNGDGS